MDGESRISKYREAAVEMQRGRFNVELPLGVGDDISELGAALADLAHTLEIEFEGSEKLAEIADRVNAGQVLPDILNFIYESFRPLIPYDRVGLALIEDDGRTVRARWARSDSSSVEIEEGYSAALKGSSLLRIIETGTPRILNNLEEHLSNHPHSESTARILREGMHSSLTCPLNARGKPIGFLFFSSMRANTYETVHQGVFRRIAGQLSMIVEKGRLYQELARTSRRLAVMQSDTEIQATHDAVTNLWNGPAIQEILKMELARVRREERPLAVLVITLDPLTDGDEQPSPATLDTIRREVAGRLLTQVRGSDTLGFLGQGKFVAVIYPCDLQTVERVAERIDRVVRDQEIETSTGPLTASVSQAGVVLEDPDADVTAEILLTAAADASSRSDQKGPGSVSVELFPAT